jgi:predicted regulator of Ras-like GTPase activity (Roadblock/LC7/MglB family)
LSERNDVAGVVLADYDGEPIASQLPDSMDVSTISKSSQSAFLHLQEAIKEIQPDRLQQITASSDGMLLEILETGSGILIVARETEPLLDFSAPHN